MEVLLGHTISPFGLRDGAATHAHGEWCVSVVPHKEPYFPPPEWRVGHQEAKVGINYRPRSDKDVHIAQSRHLRTRALLSPGTKEVVPQIEVGLNPHIGLAQGHKGRHVQDSRGVK
jgi:hypothetical protein